MEHMKLIKQRMPLKTNRFNQRLHPFFKNLTQAKIKYYYNIQDPLSRNMPIFTPQRSLKSICISINNQLNSPLRIPSPKLIPLLEWQQLCKIDFAEPSQAQQILNQRLKESGIYLKYRVSLDEQSLLCTQKRCHGRLSLIYKEDKYCIDQQLKGHNHNIKLFEI